MKKEARIIGIDDGPFDKFKKGQVLLVGVIFRGGQFMDGVVSDSATIDGTDSTDALTRMITTSRFYPQLQAVFLHGIAVGGFNVIDLKKLSKKTKLPVIVVIRDYPDFKKIYSVLKKIKMRRKITLIEKLPKPRKISKVYVQYTGTTLAQTKLLLKLTCTRSHIPEPLRIAHLIAAGIVKGESRGRA